VLQGKSGKLLEEAAQIWNKLPVNGQATNSSSNELKNHYLITVLTSGD
jgi:hypothetical protein